MRGRITREQHRFEEASTKMSAIKAVYRKLFNNILEQVQPQDLIREMQTLADALSRPGLKWDVKKIYGDTFERLQKRAQSLQTITQDLQALQSSAFTQLNAEYGFMLQPLKLPDFSAYDMDLELAKRSHLAYVGLRHSLRLQRADFVGQIVRALFHRLNALQTAVRADAHQWRLSVLAQIEAQTVLRRSHFASRLESIEKIERAAGGFDQRLRDILEREQQIKNLRQKLEDQVAHLSAANDEALAQTRSSPPLD